MSARVSREAGRPLEFTRASNSQGPRCPRPKEPRRRHIARVRRPHSWRQCANYPSSVGSAADPINAIAKIRFPLCASNIATRRDAISLLQHASSRDNADRIMLNGGSSRGTPLRSITDTCISGRLRAARREDRAGPGRAGRVN